MAFVVMGVATVVDPAHCRWAIKISSWEVIAGGLTDGGCCTVLFATGSLPVAPPIAGGRL